MAARSRPVAAIVGAGFIAEVHLEALRRLGVGVAGILASTSERSEQRARDWGTGFYPDLDAVLGDEAVDVVHLTTPNHLHFAQVRAALSAGKHVVCEKPLAVTSAETAELLALAQRSGLVHAVNFNVRYYGQLRQARRMIARGEIGAVHHVTGAYLQDWLLLQSDWNWRLDPALGGPLRAVADIGSHWIDLVCHLTGARVQAAMADLATVLPERLEPEGRALTFGVETAGSTRPRRIETEDIAGVLLRLTGGIRATLALSQMSAGRKNSLRVQVDGADGALAFDGERPEELWLGRRTGSSELLLRDPGHPDSGAPLGTLPAGHAQGFAETFRDLYREVYEAVSAGGPPSQPAYPTFADGHEEALVAEAIQASARAGCWQEVHRNSKGTA